MEVQLMIKEDYVSFETAKLLKDKGFPQELGEEGCINTIPYYTQSGGLVTCDINTIRQRYCSEAAAPTLQMAMKWIREQGFYINIDIDVDYDEDERGTKWYYEPAWDWAVFRIDDREQMSDDGALYATYEQAAEVAIKWCLENLF